MGKRSVGSKKKFVDGCKGSESPVFSRDAASKVVSYWAGPVLVGLDDDVELRDFAYLLVSCFVAELSDGRTIGSTAGYFLNSSVIASVVVANLGGGVCVRVDSGVVRVVVELFAGLPDLTAFAELCRDSVIVG